MIPTLPVHLIVLFWGYSGWSLLQFVNCNRAVKSEDVILLLVNLKIEVEHKTHEEKKAWLSAPPPTQGDSGCQLFWVKRYLGKTGQFGRDPYWYSLTLSSFWSSETLFLKDNYVCNFTPKSRILQYSDDRVKLYKSAVVQRSLVLFRFYNWGRPVFWLFKCTS